MNFIKNEQNLLKLKIYRAIKPYLHNKNALVMLFAIQFAGLVFSILTPVFYKIMIDDVLIGKRLHLLWVVAAGYFGIYLLESAVVVLSNYFSNKAYRLSILHLQAALIDIVTSIKTKELDKLNAGDLKTRIRDGEIIEGFFYHAVFEYAYSALTTAVAGIILLFIDWRLAVISFVTIPISFLMTKFLGKKKLEAAKKLRAEHVKFDGYLHSSLQNWKQIKILGLENKQDKIFTGYRNNISQLFMKNQVFWYLNRTFISIKDFFVTKMNLYFIGGLFIFANALSVGSLLVFMVYFDKMFKAIETINDLYMRFVNDRPTYERMLETLEMAQNDDKSKIVPDGFEKLVLNNVSFAYADNLPNVLENISFSLQKGDVLALSGKSGTGKSTIVKLMMHLYDDFKGEISINGIDINEISDTWLCDSFSPVMQEPYLFNLSIRENLLMGSPKATDAELHDALERAAIDDFVMSLPKGLDTVIGEKGIKLSGGQKQRLAIARAVLRNTEVIIFDEATSALDHESEKKVHQSIKAMEESKTILLISHRDSTMALAERVVEL